MRMDWKTLSMTDMTQLYLYGYTYDPSQPAQCPDLTSNSRIRPGDANTVGASVTLDALTYMSDGPGRFAQGCLSKFVEAFITGNNSVANKELIANLPNTFDPATRTHTFDKNVVRDYYIKRGIITNRDVAINIQQYHYVDGTNDATKRTYIYNSTAFQLADSEITTNAYLSNHPHCCHVYRDTDTALDRFLFGSGLVEVEVTFEMSEQTRRGYGVTSDADPETYYQDISEMNGCGEYLRTYGMTTTAPTEK